MLHLPLLFTLTLLLASLKNVLTYYNFLFAFTQISGPFTIVEDQFTQGNFSMVGIPDAFLTAQLSRMDLEPSWEDELSRLVEQFDGFPGNATVIPRIELMQYEVNTLNTLAEVSLSLTTLVQY
jgi:hypothetical protein